MYLYSFMRKCFLQDDNITNVPTRKTDELFQQQEVVFKYKALKFQ